MRADTLRILLSVLTMSSVLWYGCRKDDPPAIQKGENYTFQVPAHFPEPVYRFEQNPVSEAGFTLGRRLFFDPIMSRDQTISCGSCHQPFAAFSQFGHNVSHGVKDRLGVRNSPGLFNLNWHTSFFWDGGVNHIENQPANPITNPLEMDETLEGIVGKLRSSAEYPQLFQQAFGDTLISTQRIFRSLAQFMGLMVSADAKYDKVARGAAGVAFTEVEQSGLNVFREKCVQCHTEPLFSDFSFRNNGLALLPNTQGEVDLGRGVIEPNDSGSYYRFKVPSLRNLKYTQPYMHDGRFTTIDEVLDHYSNGIHVTLNLDPLLQTGLSLSTAEKSALKAFLETLNDETFVKDPRFQEPQ